MNSHFAHLTVTVTNLDGVNTETQDVTEAIEDALRSAGYEASVSIDNYGAYTTEEN